MILFPGIIRLGTLLSAMSRALCYHSGFFHEFIALPLANADAEWATTGELQDVEGSSASGPIAL